MQNNKIVIDNVETVTQVLIYLLALGRLVEDSEDLFNSDESMAHIAADTLSNLTTKLRYGVVAHQSIKDQLAPEDYEVVCKLIYKSIKEFSQTKGFAGVDQYTEISKELESL